jgi:predicted extracellular nuclease
VDDMGDYTYVPALDDELDYVQGPLNYSYSAFKIEPRGDGDIGKAEVCGDPFTPIYEVQGSGYVSPIVGQVVSVEGVVTGDYQTSDELDGFFLQDPAGDYNPATSDGVFVYAPGAIDVAEGDLVRVRGTVNEYYTLTEIGSVELVLVCGASGVGATVTDLPVPVDLEPYEGMLVTFPEDLTASQNYFQGRYGQVTMSAEGRLFNPTNTYRPLTDEALAMAAENWRRMIVLDDGLTAQNPYPIPYIGADNTLRAGDTVAGLTGVIDYGPINSSYPPARYYRLQPTAPVEFTRVNERTEAPQDVGGVIRIASFNVLNYFNGDGMGGGFPTSRGADTLEEFVRQRDKIIPAILAMDADVIGLMEIENDGYDQYSAIQDLVNGLNDVAGAGTYAFIDPGVAPVGTDEIAVGLIYRSGTVTPVGAAAIIDSSVDPDFNSDYNRPAIAQTFERSAGGGRFTAVVNHLKSKGSPCDAISDPDIGDGQGNCNLTREAAAIALSEWLATDPTGSGDPDFFIIGDLNSYAMEDPIIALEERGYNNLVKAHLGTWAYSYIFDGLAGYLDHSLATGSAAMQVVGATIWHINTDEPSIIDYNTEYKPEDLYTATPYRSSDHDPVIVGFCDAVPPEVDVTVTEDMLWPPNHKYVDVEATVVVSDNFDPEPTVTLVSVESDEPDAGLDDEDVPVDIVIVDDYTFQLRAERWDEGDGRVYTIVYQVTDACGNLAMATVTVTVPHDRRPEK